MNIGNRRKPGRPGLRTALWVLLVLAVAEPRRP